MELAHVEFKIGKFKGKTFEEVCESEHNYNQWILSIPNVTGQLADYKRYILCKTKQSLDQDTVNFHKHSTRTLHSITTDNKVRIIARKTTHDDHPVTCLVKRQNEKPISLISKKVHILDSKTSSGKVNTTSSSSPLSMSMATGNDQIDDNFQMFFVNINNNSDCSSNMQCQKKKNVDGTISFEIIDDENFKLLHKRYGYNNRIPYEVYNTLDKFNPVVRLRDNDRIVTFRAEVYGGLLDHLKQNFIFESEIEELPVFVKRAFPHFCNDIRLKPYNISYSTTIDKDEVRTRIGDLLYDSLKPFQRQGVEFGISRAGKLILGDEMGLGKTLQALAIAAYYHNDWPLLIVCPSSLRFQWKDEILSWLPHLVNELEIYTIKTSKIKDLSLRIHKILILSYDHLVRIGGYLQHYACVVCDESHFIKNKNAKRTKVLLPIMKNATRVILCSGTPSLNNPSELYHQIAPLVDKFASFNDFANRYSYSSIHKFSRKVNYNGCKHGDELHSFLVRTIMLRRLKKNVQKDLPSKIRSKIIIDISMELKSKFIPLLAQIKNKEDIVDNNAIVELFNFTCEAKREGVCDYVNYLVGNNHKFILFAHHISMLDSLEGCVQKSGVDYIRIDGSTSQCKREDLVKRFQTCEDCKIAILSLTACGQGLNLTAASIVVMTELYWVPGLLFQAEDRAHRIGAQGVTHVYYLIAKNTLDEVIWRLVSRKWKDVTNTLDGKKENILMDSDDAGNNKQSNMLSYLV